MPEGAVYVGRPTVFGNPFSVGAAKEYHDLFGQPRNGESPAQTAVRWYRAWLNGDPMARADCRPPSKEQIASLRGRHLACFCRLDHPCHTSVLLELANK